MHLGGYDTTDSCKYNVSSKYVTDDSVKDLIEFLMRKKKVWFSIYYEFDIEKAVERGKEIIMDILEIINDWWGAYKYIVKPVH